MSEDSRTRKPGKVSLHLLRFEDALKGLLKTKPNRPTEAEPSKRASEREVRQTPEND